MNQNPNWRDNFVREVTLKCKNDYCENLVTVIAASKHQGVYCESCRAEAAKIHKQNYESRNREARRARKRVSKRHDVH